MFKPAISTYSFSVFNLYAIICSLFSATLRMQLEFLLQNIYTILFIIWSRGRNVLISEQLIYDKITEKSTPTALLKNRLENTLILPKFSHFHNMKVYGFFMKAYTYDIDNLRSVFVLPTYKSVVIL